MQRDPRHDHRREDCADIAARIKQPDCQRAFAAREPFRHGLDGGGKIPRLAQAQRKPRRTETKHAAGQRVRHGRQAPEKYRDGVTVARADGIHQSPKKEEAQRVGRLKGHDDMAIVNFIPAERLFQGWGEDAQHLAVHVIDRGRHEEQRANGPAKTPKALMTGLGGLLGRGLHNSTSVFEFQNRSRNHGTAVGIHLFLHSVIYSRLRHPPAWRIWPDPFG